MREVAEYAGVSITTVSHVINQTRFVSEELADRVSEAIRKLEYRPDQRARSLRTGSTETLAALVSDISNPFFPKVVRGIEDCARESGYSVLLSNTDESAETERVNLSTMLERRVDGFIVAPSIGDSDALENLIRHGTPVVLIDRPDDLPVDQVYSENERGAYEATKHLIDLGHTRIGIVAEIADIPSFRSRVVGWKKALVQAGLSPHTGDLRQAGLEVEGAYAAAKRLLSGSDPVSAIFSTNNLMTLGVFRYLKDAGISCPQVVSVVGFDDPDWASAFSPAITSVAQQPYEMGYKATELLLERIKGNTSPPKTICLLCELRIRESTGQPAADSPRSLD